MFSLVHGNIFDASGTFSYAQCISSDTSSGMFRGIAVDFLSHFPELEVLRSYDMSNTVGKAVPVDIGGKHIFNLVSKTKFYGKPTTLTMESCLESMKIQALNA